MPSSGRWTIVPFSNDLLSAAETFRCCWCSEGFHRAQLGSVQVTDAGAALWSGFPSPASLRRQFPLSSAAVLVGGVEQIRLQGGQVTGCHLPRGCG